MRGTILPFSLALFLNTGTIFSDDCAAAKVIATHTFTDSIDTSGFTVEPDEPTECGLIGATTWYRFTPSVSGVVNVDTVGLDFASVVALYEGTCQNLTLVACENGASVTRVPVDAGTTYYVQAGGFLGASGNLRLNFNSRGNVRLGFPQIAVGDTATTTVDLVNGGTQAFKGLLAIFDDEGNLLPVSINNTPVSDDLALEIQPRSVQRLEITREGPSVAGHIIVYDRRTLQTINLNEQIDGTLIYQFQEAGMKYDTIGVPAANVFFAPGVKQHFYFFAERNNSINTGVALANPGSPASRIVDVTVRAISDLGEQVGETVVRLNPLHHTAFFVDERIALPEGFRGTVVVEANGPVFAVALRSQGTRLSDMRLSTVQVSPVSAAYDFEINLLNGKQYSGEMTFNIADVKVQGLARFTSQTPDKDYEITPLTGASISGLLIGTMYTSFESSPVAVVIYGVLFTTQLENLGGGVVWMGLDGAVLGTFSATRRGVE